MLTKLWNGPEQPCALGRQYSELHRSAFIALKMDTSQSAHTRIALRDRFSIRWRDPICPRTRVLKRVTCASKIIETWMRWLKNGRCPKRLHRSLRNYRRSISRLRKY